jgi:hypothetical protein
MVMVLKCNGEGHPGLAVTPSLDQTILHYCSEGNGYGVFVLKCNGYGVGE